MRKVFLDELPRTFRGIDWVNSVGYTVKFIYDNIEGEFEIIEYDKDSRDLIFKYNDNIYNKYTSTVLACKFADMMRTHYFGYRYNIDDIVGKNKNITILQIIGKSKSKNKSKLYKCKCLKCGGEFERIEYLLDNCSCPICEKISKIVVSGINDLWITHPEYAKLLLNKECGYLISYGSKKTVDWSCPMCGEIIRKSVKEVINKGLVCPCCSNNMSFGEKAFYGLCIQLKELGLIEDFKSQYSPKWANGKRYDFKIDGDKESIVEINGIGHYNGCFESCGGRSLEEEQKNDLYKEQLVKQNTDYYYVILDVRESTIDWFRNSIMNSMLPTYYGFAEDSINWDRINEHTFTSLKMDVWKLFNIGYNITEISRIYKISKHAIRDYLKIGAEYEKCLYNSDRTLKYKKVICLSTNEVYNSITEASREMNVSRRGIRKCCNNEGGYAGKLSEDVPLKWMFLNKYEDMTNIQTSFKDTRKMAIVCLTTGEIFNSVIAAAVFMNIDPSGISKCCKNKAKSAGKHPDTGEKLVWQYYSDYIILQQQQNQIAS